MAFVLFVFVCILSLILHNSLNLEFFFSLMVLLFLLRNFDFSLPPRTSHDKTRLSPSYSGPTTPDTSRPDASYTKIWCGGTENETKMVNRMNKKMIKMINQMVDKIVLFYSFCILNGSAYLKCLITKMLIKVLNFGPHNYRVPTA